MPSGLRVAAVPHFLPDGSLVVSLRLISRGSDAFHQYFRGCVGLWLFSKPMEELTAFLVHRALDKVSVVAGTLVGSFLFGVIDFGLEVSDPALHLGEQFRTYAAREPDVFHGAVNGLDHAGLFAAIRGPGVFRDVLASDGYVPDFVVGADEESAALGWMVPTLSVDSFGEVPDGCSGVVNHVFEVFHSRVDRRTLCFGAG